MFDYWMIIRRWAFFWIFCWIPRNQFLNSCDTTRQWTHSSSSNQKRESLLRLLTSIMWLVVIIYSLIYSSRREWKATVTAVDAKGIYTYTDILSLTSSSDRKQNKMKVVFPCLLYRRFHHGIMDTFKWYANRLVDIFDQSTRNTRKDLACVCSSNWSNTLITEREREAIDARLLLLFSSRVFEIL